MTRRHSPRQQLKEAKQIARDHGLIVVERQDARGVTNYLVYRQTAPRNTFVGRRRDIGALRAMVCKAANFH